MLWQVMEHPRAIRNLARTAPQIKRKYQFWLGLMQTQGPLAVGLFPGFKDKALKGNLLGLRASRLNEQYRVIYRIEEEQKTVYVENVDPHTYRL